jgi:uncharacterized NAD-dependent epimerase/dehydratase family protein
MPSPAIVLANDRFRTPNGKTAHGLVRGSDRFDVKAVVDPTCAGQDAGEVLDGTHRGIPIVATMDEALAAAGPGVTWCVVGVATHGGRITAAIRDLILDAVRRGLSVANGLHDAASDDAEIAAAAKDAGVELVDLRKAPPKHELHFWEGDIFGVKAPRVAVLGTDCALGKRTTTRMLTQALVADGVRAEMIYTGQTGWMQGARYGFVFDSIINDFVSGELEHAVVSCDREVRPDVMLIEGQSSLRNPSGPCGAEMLLSAGCRAVVLQHAPGREFMEGYEKLGVRVPSPKSEAELIAMYDSRVIAVTLNEDHCDDAQMRMHKARIADEMGVPVVRPLVDGVDEVLPALRHFMAAERARAAS